MLLYWHRQRFLTVEGYVGEVDVFHATNFLAPSQRKGRSVVTIHDLSVLLFPEYHPRMRVLGYRAFLGATLARADAVITDSEQTKRDLVRLMGVSNAKVTVIPLATNEAFRPVALSQACSTVARYGLQPNRYFLHVGTIEPRKNVLRLLRAFERICRTDSMAPSLVFCGGSGWRNREFYRAVETSPVKASVRVLGYVPEDDLAALYSASLATVYPSLYEGFGLPPLEAMACGSPVITSNASSLPEVVGEAALLVDPHDTAAIEAALVRVQDDSELRETLREQGLKRAKQFSWETTARRTLAVYGLADSLPTGWGARISRLVAEDASFAPNLPTGGSL